jgi:hypothetical protein
MHVLDEEQRLFSFWGSVEIVDDEGEILVIKELEKVLDIMEQRGAGGAPITIGHSNRIVGHTVQQTPTQYKLEDGREVPAVYGVGKIFQHYPIDDQAWEDIKKWIRGEADGYTGISLGGNGKRYKSPNCQDDTCPSAIKKIQGLEWSLAKKPMNPLARIIRKLQDMQVSGYDPEQLTNIAKELSIANVEESTMEKEEKEELVKEFAALLEKGLEPVTKEIEELKTGLEEVKKAQEEKPEPEPEKVEKEEEPEPVEKMEDEEDKKDKKKEKKEVCKEDLEAMEKRILERLEEQFKKEVEEELDNPDAGVESPSPGGQTGAITKEAIETGQTQEGDEPLIKEPWDASKTYEY